MTGGGAPQGDGPTDGASSDGHHRRACGGEDWGGKLCEFLAPTTVVVCVGSELRGDDAVGVAIADELVGSVPWEVVNAGNAPENFVGRIAATAPESVLLIDALSFDAPPGSIMLAAPEEIGGHGPSTHGPAPVLFLEVLTALHPCRCAVLGVQPARLDVGAPLSEPVAAAAGRIVRALRELARPTG